MQSNNIRVVIVDDDDGDFLILETLLRDSKRFLFEIDHVKSFQN